MMQKTRLGIGVGLFGAALYLMAFLNGSVVAILLAGYVLLFEQNEWLRKTAVKAVSLMVVFGLLISVVGFMTDFTGLAVDFVGMFGLNLSIPFVNSFVALIDDLIRLFEKVLFILLGLTALGQSSLPIPVVDDLIRKYMN